MSSEGLSFLACFGNFSCLCLGKNHSTLSLGAVFQQRVYKKRYSHFLLIQLCEYNTLPEASF
ncbi:hypothetical protein APHDU1_0315 [Anaplasma phagocytophilum]|uniref:Uncharacterized protein n=1 Tax=Anaplasma phagocytophilum str. NCH-1 TaxID=1359161 RepID=A0A0F3N486_ANAPH|nr:hypothetical protein EPHNCH_1350 [Anaplasma phagocytophilum str. NCH-1]KJV82768.1 hypothetical protein APHHGE2_1330 [Anaplasma phagocytophilum str. HGE2]KJV87039.1 hypothetical protein APHNYW_1046 [Anaplasma phagocytophilum str. ApNYW]KJV98277.1 hypothetical protein OTSANNIE_1304 [Anaplasma phagocytophilum str. Annie]KKA00128.1 hypothetical protein APHDU1_0315 [Anaplasma phagocytophilum]